MAGVTAYPGAIDGNTNLPQPGSGDLVSVVDHAQLHDNVDVAIIATQTKLGTGATTAAVNQLLVGTGSGTSAWQGLTSAQLAAIISDETGSGKAVFGTSPTLTTPVIASIVNTGTLTLPTSTDTLVGRATTDTLTNKTINGSQLVNTSVSASKLATGATQVFVTTQETTTSVSYTDLTTTTDSVTVTIGANGLALVSVYVGNMTNNTATSRAYATFAISGATTQAAADSYAVYLLTSGISVPQVGKSATHLLTGLTPGSTTFKMKYRVDAGTGSFQYRRISVVPL